MHSDDFSHKLVMMRLCEPRIINASPNSQIADGTACLRVAEGAADENRPSDQEERTWLVGAWRAEAGLRRSGKVLPLQRTLHRTAFTVLCCTPATAKYLIDTVRPPHRVRLQGSAPVEVSTVLKVSCRLRYCTHTSTMVASVLTVGVHNAGHRWQ